MCMCVCVCVYLLFLWVEIKNAPCRQEDTGYSRKNSKSLLKINTTVK